MLINLHVKNLALIEEADINFSDGLNIITGETGAGKSILIGSINAALGNKVSADFVRSGADYGLVELTFYVESKKIIEQLKALDVPDIEDGELIITRKIQSGRSAIKINGETRTVSEVKKITSLLIDIHGQHEHQSLLNRTNYIPIIDKYAQDELAGVKDPLSVAYEEYRTLKRQQESFNLDAESLKRELAFMEYEIKEIDEANLSIGEDESLEQTFRLYNNSRRIMDNVNTAMELLSLDRINASDNISNALRSVNQVADYDRENLDDIVSQLSQLEDLMNGLNADLRNYVQKLDFDEEEYKKVEERLSLINNLKSKYGKSISDILTYRENQDKKRQEYLDYEDNKARIEQQISLAKEKVLALCSKVTDIRKKAGNLLSEDIKKALLELNFLDVQFNIIVDETDNFSENGNNEVEFLISTNPGEATKPLAKVASGGELSRIMLAIKTVLSDKDEISTLIFDEIDTGISGRTAQMVAVKLNENSRHHQVLCITHLPQIAAMADAHFVIEKKVIDNKTVTSIQLLENDESVTELARLLGGTSITENVLNNAKEMKELAKNSKIN